MGVVAEVEGGEVEKVDDQDDLGPNEVRSNKQHDECKLEEVVEDEVASDTRSSLDVVIVIREEVPDVADLK